MLAVPSQKRKTGLRHGDISDIARRLDYSVNHVWACARGARVGSPKLMRAIEVRRAKRERERAEQERTAEPVAIPA